MTGICGASTEDERITRNKDFCCFRTRRASHPSPGNESACDTRALMMNERVAETETAFLSFFCRLAEAKINLPLFVFRAVCVRRVKTMEVLLLWLQPEDLSTKPRLHVPPPAVHSQICASPTFPLSVRFVSCLVWVSVSNARTICDHVFPKLRAPVT